MKASSYRLFLATAKEGAWTWIFQQEHRQLGAATFIVNKEDALRVETKPEDAAYTEYLMYGFDNRKGNSSATAYLQWENKRIPLSIEVPNVNDIYLGIIRNELRNFPGLMPDFSTAASILRHQ